MSALRASISCLCISIISWRCSARIWFPLPGPGGACAGLSCAHIAGIRANIRTSRELLIFIANFIANLLSGNIGHGEYRPARGSFSGAPTHSDPRQLKIKFGSTPAQHFVWLPQLHASATPTQRQLSSTQSASEASERARQRANPTATATSVPLSLLCLLVCQAL